jgi:fumarylacetoacetase
VPSTSQLRYPPAFRVPSDPARPHPAESALDETHDPQRESWVASAQGHPEFPIQNLPLGVFSRDDGAPRGGIAIGDSILDLRAALEAGLFPGKTKTAAEAAAGPALNPLMALGRTARVTLRRRVSQLLAADGRERKSVEALASRLLHKAGDCTMHLPATIGDYTDFFAGIHHATNSGRLNRPGGDPLTPNYKHVPIAYHGRASSITVSGATVRRPHGQRLAAGESAPSFGPSLRLDYEYEFGVWIGPGNALGEAIPIARAGEHVFGFGLLNDMSARDVQRWEMMPLGPFLSKNFATVVSPWIVTTEALAPFRVPQPPRAAGDPRPLPYLWDDADQQLGALDVALEALLVTPALKRKGLRRTFSRAPTPPTSTGPSPRWWRTTPAAAATSRPATCSAAAPSRGRAATASAA